jgi:hypothetical protein
MASGLVAAVIKVCLYMGKLYAKVCLFIVHDLSRLGDPHRIIIPWSG